MNLFFFKPNKIQYCNLEQIKIINFQQFLTEEALLSIFSSQNTVPFLIKRVFTIQATEDCFRGFHAHKICNQLMIALQGIIKVTCDDGMQKKTFILNSPSQGLLVPATLWAEQEYIANATLMILTDQFYDANDYIRDYQDFLKFRNVL